MALQAWHTLALSLVMHNFWDYTHNVPVMQNEALHFFKVRWWHLLLGIRHHTDEAAIQILPALCSLCLPPVCLL
jgi:hypothetical protein